MQIFSSKRSFHFFVGVLVVLSLVQSIGVVSRAQAFALDGFLKDYFRNEPSLDDPPPDPFPTKLPPPSHQREFNDGTANPSESRPREHGPDTPDEPDRPGNESFGAPDFRRAVPVRPWNPCQGEVDALNACIIRVSRPNDREQIR